VLEPSELTPLIALRLAELAAEVLPPGVLDVITGDRETCRSTALEDYTQDQARDGEAGVIADRAARGCARRTASGSAWSPDPR